MKRMREGNQNWVPVWPQLDQGYGGQFIWEDMERVGDQPEPDYADLDLSSVRHFKGEREIQRKLKLGHYSQYMDMHQHELNEGGEQDMWQKDNMIYNLGKFKMDKKLLGVDDADFDTVMT